MLRVLDVDQREPAVELVHADLEDADDPEALERAAACPPGVTVPCGVMTHDRVAHAHAERARELAAQHDAELAGLEVGERARAHVLADVGDRVLARGIDAADDRAAVDVARRRASPARARTARRPSRAASRARPSPTAASPRAAARRGSRCARRPTRMRLRSSSWNPFITDSTTISAATPSAMPAIEIERDERDERVAAGALAGARVAQADGQFVRATRGGVRGRTCGGAKACASIAATAECAPRSSGTCDYRMLPIAHALAPSPHARSSCIAPRPAASPPIALAGMRRRCARLLRGAGTPARRRSRGSRDALAGRATGARRGVRDAPPRAARLAAARRRGSIRRTRTVLARRSGDAASPAATTCCSPAASTISPTAKPPRWSRRSTRHFAADGLAFRRAARRRVVRAVAATPRARRRRRSTRRAGRPLRALPAAAAPTRARWRRWLTEMQMLLHEHPANAAREARGRSPVTGVWFWGGGARRRTPPASRDVAPRRPRGRRRARPRARTRRRRGRDRCRARLARRSPRRGDALVSCCRATADATRAGRRTGSRRRARRSSAARSTRLTLVADGAAPRGAGRRRRPAFAARAAPRAGAAARSCRCSRRRRDRMTSTSSAAPCRRGRGRAGRGGHAAGARAHLRGARHRDAASELDHALSALPPPSRRCAASTRPPRGCAARSPRASASSIVADYDADGATACAVGVRGLRAMGADVDFLVPNRFEYGYGLTPEIVALRRAARAAPARHRRQRHRERRRRRGGGRARASTCWSPTITCPAATLPAPAIIVNPNQPGCAFPSKHLAGVGVMFYVLARHARAAARARRVRGAARAQSRRPARPRRAGHRRRRRAARPASTASSSSRDSRASAPAARSPASPRCSRVAGRDPRARDRLRPGLRRRPAAQRRRPARRHDDRHPLPARRRPRRGAARSPRELDRLNRERRDVEAAMQEEALADLADVADAPRRGPVHALPVPSRVAPGRRRHRRVAAQGPLPSAGDRVRARRRRRAARARGARSRASTCATRSTSSPSARRALIARFGGHAFAAGLTLAEAGAAARSARPSRRSPRERLTPGDLERTLRDRRRARARAS